MPGRPLTVACANFYHTEEYSRCQAYRHFTDTESQINIVNGPDFSSTGRTLDGYMREQRTIASHR